MELIRRRGLSSLSDHLHATISRFLDWSRTKNLSWQAVAFRPERREAFRRFAQADAPTIARRDITPRVIRPRLSHAGI